MKIISDPELLKYEEKTSKKGNLYIFLGALILGILIGILGTIFAITFHYKY